jgi:ABC-type Fe3+/spermidine/putrescine transport system ATPase subunit
MVFQSLALWPPLSVEKHLDCVLHARRVPRPERRRRIAQVGTSEEIYRRPLDAEVARLAGPVSLVPGRFRGEGRAQCVLGEDRIEIEVDG